MNTRADEQLTNEIVAMIFAEPTWCQLAALILFPLYMIFDQLMKYWLPYELFGYKLGTVESFYTIRVHLHAHMSCTEYL